MLCVVYSLWNTNVSQNSIIVKNFHGMTSLTSYGHPLMRIYERALVLAWSTSKSAEVITIDEENHIWTSNALGEENGKQLVETLVY